VAIALQQEYQRQPRKKILYWGISLGIVWKEMATLCVPGATLAVTSAIKHPLSAA